MRLFDYSNFLSLPLIYFHESPSPAQFCTMPNMEHDDVASHLERHLDSPKTIH